jgi:hypothetical protein
MANFILVQLLVTILFTSTSWSGVDRLTSEVHLGEKALDGYAGRYEPLIFHDIYQGKMFFKDELFFQHYFEPYSFGLGREMSFFLKSELGSGLSCSNELFSEHFDEIRYSYRLITLSYFLEAQWHMNLHSNHFDLKNGCSFDLEKWAKGCTPESESMKKFLARLIKFNPKYEETLPRAYNQMDWLNEVNSGKPQSYSQYRIQAACQGKCTQAELPQKFNSICHENHQLMDMICSEKDQLYGLSTQRDAYSLIGQSNIINTYNKRGEAMGCLRRFSEVMSHKEVKYRHMMHLFPVLQNKLRELHGERFLQGRVFFYGAGKEFDDKGLADLYVKDQPLQIATVSKTESAPTEGIKQKITTPIMKKTEVALVVQAPKKKEIIEIREESKSAFLQAAEIRSTQNLSRVEIDMLKLKYDYVFTLNMMNTLSERLKTFMTREALLEMMTYDNLGTATGPVPLLFLKFMIDMQEHQGIWNIISVLGDKFYVSNEIDAKFNPGPEYIQLVNNESTGRQWQMVILRP